MNQEKAKFPGFSQHALVDKESLIWIGNLSESSHPKLWINTQQLSRHRCRIGASDSANNVILGTCVKMRCRRPSKAPSKLKAFSKPAIKAVLSLHMSSIKMLSVCPPSLLKSDCAAIDSLRSDKRLRAWTCQPVNHWFLTFPSALCISSSPELVALHARKENPTQTVKAYKPTGPERPHSPPNNSNLLFSSWSIDKTNKRSY